MATALFLFRRDLRLVDNTALNEAIRLARDNGLKIVPAFVLDTKQINRKTNKYFSNAAVQFMCESLADLDKSLQKYGTHLHIMQGDTLSLLRKVKPQIVVFNKDYSVYARKRDAGVQKWCNKHNVLCHGEIEDYDLVPLSEGRLPDGRPYTNLSQYFARFTSGSAARPQLTVKEPTSVSMKPVDFASVNIACLDVSKLEGCYDIMPDLAQHGGRKEGSKVLSRIEHGDYEKYESQRDLPSVEGTTKASAHLHFGTISVREMYWALRTRHGADHGLIRELVFRSFYIKIYTHNERLQRGEAYNSGMDKHISWNSKDKATGLWQAWTDGTTGYPLVDAGMRQLKQTGWVHNRVRMLVATVPTRYLLLDWRDCAQFFYTCLVDADTFSNTAGWQWSAGIGPDAAPYFRAPMNPFIQSKKFDVDAVYIKRWVPELAEVSPNDIHRWDEEKIRQKYPTCSYPAPIIPQKEASRTSVAMFKQAALLAKSQ